MSSKTLDIKNSILHLSIFSVYAYGHGAWILCLSAELHMYPLHSFIIDIQDGVLLSIFRTEFYYRYSGRSFIIDIQDGGRWLSKN